MTDFRTLPSERALELINRWANAPWPMTLEQGHELALTLGWRPTADGPDYYASELSSAEMDSFFNRLNGMLSAITFPLITRLPKETLDPYAALARAYYDDIVATLKALYGRPKLDGNEKFRSVKWTLPNGASISIINYNIGCDAFISSPARNGLLSDPAADPNPDETDL